MFRRLSLVPATNVLLMRKEHEGHWDYLCERVQCLLAALQSAVAIFLKSNFEYVRQNYRKCAKLLSTAPLSDDSIPGCSYLPALYFNNMGCAHSHMHKHHLAAFYFHRALRLNSQVLSECMERRGRLSHSHLVQPVSTFNFTRLESDWSVWSESKLSANWMVLVW